MSVPTYQFKFSLDWNLKNQLSPQQVEKQNVFTDTVINVFQSKTNSAFFKFSDNKVFVIRRDRTNELQFFQLCNPSCCMSSKEPEEKITSLSIDLFTIYQANQANRAAKLNITPEQLRRYQTKKL
ncbi:hypothetical protein D5018_00180 [Parashewanella curva]|uniref:Uncharacterized protein n=1 Tax=Parashewanella curva TaxID=2338552 RepID=A0A3L8Q1R0_9GAMM|nr:hypothetical protein [Parashewanella curva]RLV61571.1 hypothetical protein D5018_00180 [Parashewanella curva]